MSKYFTTSYMSVSKIAQTDAEMSIMIKQAQIRNKALNITGVLFYNEGLFFQTLEGEQTDVEEVMASILVDPRHTKVTVVNETLIKERLFGDWSMHGFGKDLVKRDPTASIETLRESDAFVDSLHSVFLRDLQKKRPLH